MWRHLTVVLWLQKGAYPKNSHVLYCHIKLVLLLIVYMFGSYNDWLNKIGRGSTIPKQQRSLPLCWCIILQLTHCSCALVSRHVCVVRTVHPKNGLYLAAGCIVNYQNVGACRRLISLLVWYHLAVNRHQIKCWSPYGWSVVLILFEGS